VKIKKIINNQRQRRRFRVRAKVRGTAERPRLSVQRSLRHFSVQLIDDERGHTLAAASTLESAVAGYGGNAEAAAKIGKLIAEKAQGLGIKQACLDRGACKYHGRVAAFATAAREAGLEL
jgi:large subunit ribosomal protein L18